MNICPSTVVVALSGGVDSSLGAALLREAGWEVSGLHFLLPASRPRSEEKIARVRQLGAHLGIPVTFLDLSQAFTEKVIGPFIAAYLEGRTPNPCVLCNPAIKFEYLLAHARERGIDHIATGHYAGLKHPRSGRHELWRGADPKKEQSYFLHRLEQRHLRKTLFPLQELTKQQARALSREKGLPAADDPESQEVCFIPGDDYRGFLERRAGRGITRTGPIVNLRGEEVGEHRGTYRYTIGQRQGLGIASPRPYYVAEVRPDENVVVVGRKEDLSSSRLEAGDFNWIGGAPHEKDRCLLAQIRYRHRAAPGRLRVLGAGRVAFEFEEPQWGITPGQALVCYEGDRVVGGGWIRGRREPFG